MSMTENNTHAEIIAQVRIHAQMNIDAEKDKRELGILSVEGAIANDFADELEAAHKREVDALQAQIDELTQKIPQPDPAWREICEKCHDGEEPPDCEYFGEPNGCNSPIYGEHHRRNSKCNEGKGGKQS